LLIQHDCLSHAAICLKLITYFLFILSTTNHYVVLIRIFSLRLENLYINYISSIISDISCIFGAIFNIHK